VLSNYDVALARQLSAWDDCHQALARTGVAASSVAYPERVSTYRLLSGLADSGGAGHFVPVPWRLVYYSMRQGESVRIPLPLRADSVLGLVRPAPELPRGEVWPVPENRLQTNPRAG
jgi:hypothetical protein